MRPLCKDCAYFSAVGTGMCRHPDNVDAVNGDPDPEPCYTMRGYRPESRCGFEGRLFVPKKP